MLRTSNKRLSANLWTIAHFVASFACVACVLSSVLYFAYAVPGGASTSTAHNDTGILFDLTALEYFSWASDEAPYLTPISTLLLYMCPWKIDDGDVISGVIYGISFGLDASIYVNFALWFLQLLLFIPSFSFNWLERKKGE